MKKKTKYGHKGKTHAKHKAGTPSGIGSFGTLCTADAVRLHVCVPLEMGETPRLEKRFEDDTSYILNGVGHKPHM